MRRFVAVSFLALLAWALLQAVPPTARLVPARTQLVWADDGSSGERESEDAPDESHHDETDAEDSADDDARPTPDDSGDDGEAREAPRSGSDGGTHSAPIDVSTGGHGTGVSGAGSGKSGGGAKVAAAPLVARSVEPGPPDSVAATLTLGVQRAPREFELGIGAPATLPLMEVVRWIALAGTGGLIAIILLIVAGFWAKRRIQKL